VKKRESIGQRHAGPGANADVQGKLSFSVSLEGLYQRMDSSYLGTGDEVWASTPLRTLGRGQKRAFRHLGSSFHACTATWQHECRASGHTSWDGKLQSYTRKVHIEYEEKGDAADGAERGGSTPK